MKRTEIFRKIGGIIAEITEQYDYLAKNPDSFNELEMELFMANSRFLSDHIAILQKLGNEAPAPEKKEEDVPFRQYFQPEPQQQQAIEEPSALEDSPEESSTHMADQPIVAAEVEEPIVQHTLEVLPELEANEEPEIETLEEEQEAPVRYELPAIEEDEPDVAPEVVIEHPIADHLPLRNAAITEGDSLEDDALNFSISSRAEAPANTTSDAPPTRNDILSAQLNPNRVNQLSKQPVKDLKSIISLNDKLLFVKELFNGYSLAYSEAIELLNRFDTFEAADNFLKVNYAQKNNWSEKPAAAEHFYELLSRKFAK